MGISRLKDRNWLIDPFAYSGVKDCSCELTCFFHFFNSRIPDCNMIIGNTFDHHSATADFHIVSNMNVADDTNIASYINIISDYGRIAETFIFQLLIAYRSAMPQGAILANDNPIVHNQSLSMEQTKVFTDFYIPWDFNTKNPFNKKPVK